MLLVEDGASYYGWRRNFTVIFSMHKGEGELKIEKYPGHCFSINLVDPAIRLTKIRLTETQQCIYTKEILLDSKKVNKRKSVMPFDFR